MNLAELDLEGHFHQALHAPDDEARAEILSAVRTSDTYRQIREDVIGGLKNYFLNEIDTSQLMKDYPLMNGDEQAAVLRDIGQKQAALTTESIKRNCPETHFFIPSTRVTWTTWSEQGATDRGRAGVETDDSGTEPTPGHMLDDILLNQNDITMKTDLLHAAVTTCHEQEHFSHVTLARADRWGWMRDDHPLKGEGAYYSKQWQKTAFFKQGAPYETQLDERNARYVGDALDAFFEEEFGEYRISPSVDCQPVVADQASELVQHATHFESPELVH